MEIIANKRHEILDLLFKLAVKKPEKMVPVPEELEGFRKIVKVNPSNCVVCEKCKDQCEVNAISRAGVIDLAFYLNSINSEGNGGLLGNRAELAGVIKNIMPPDALEKGSLEVKIPDGAYFYGVMNYSARECIGCEKCVEACPNDVIKAELYYDLPEIFNGFTPPEIDVPKAPANWEPVITAFTCQWCTYAAADLAGTSRMQYPPNVRIIKIPCTGKMDILYALHALRTSDGVLVSGCLPNQCHYIDGNFKAEKRMIFIKDILEEIGIGGNRLEMHFISASMATTFVEVVHEFRETVKKLGPNPARITRS